MKKLFIKLLAHNDHMLNFNPEHYVKLHNIQVGW